MGPLSQLLRGQTVVVDRDSSSGPAEGASSRVLLVCLACWCPGPVVHPHTPALHSRCRLISVSDNAVDQHLIPSSKPLSVDFYRDLFFSSVLGKVPPNIYSLTGELVFALPSEDSAAFT